MKTETILNSNEIAAVKDCLKRYTDFNNNGVMSSYKAKRSSLLLMDERDIDIDLRGYKIPLNECIRFGTMWG